MDWAATGSFHSAARQAFLRVLPFVNIIAGWVGYWLFTSADPGAAPADQHTGLRNFIRVFAVLMIVRGLLHLTETVYGGTTPAGHISNVIATGIAIVGLAATFCELHYFGKLAVRIPDWKLASYANRLKVWLVLGDAYMLLVTAGLALLIRHPRPAPAVRGAIQPWVYVVVFVVMLILWSPSLISHVFYILMLNRFRAAFKQQAAEARLRGSGVWVERQGGG